MMDASSQLAARFTVLTYHVVTCAMVGTSGVSNSASSAEEPPAEAKANKKERRRIKKLLKRANAVSNQPTNRQSISGISSRTCWKELVNSVKERQNESNERINREIMGPSVLWRSANKHQQHADRAVYPSDTRDMLFSICSTNNEFNTATAAASGIGKKRKRQDKPEEKDGCGLPIRIPSWATLHNPAAIEHVVVLELHLQSFNGVIEKRILHYLTKQQQENSDRSILKVPAQWFRGPNPKSVSEALMYSPQMQPVSKHSNQLTHHVSSSLEHLHLGMSLLTMTPQQWQNEGYPCISNGNECPGEIAASLLTQDTCTPSDIPIEQARDIVKKFRVEVTEDTNESSTADRIHPLPPFVSTPSTSTSMPPSSSSSSSSSSSRSPRIYALDCEMVRTTAGSELARITLMQAISCTNDDSPVEIETLVVWDKVVLPVYKVTDYVTEYSGMTPAIMENANITIEQVQAALLSTISADDIVVGHSLENDLRASRWIHPRVVDTAVLFKGNNTRFKYSLRHLAAALLNKKIQRVDRPHCSEEDAVTALQLAVRRAVEGQSFGIKSKSQTNRLSELSQGGTAVCIGPADWLQQHLTCQANAIHALTCETIHDRNAKAVKAWLVGPKRRARFVWANFPLDECPEDADTIENLLNDVVSKMGETDTIVAVCLQQGYEQASKLRKQRRIHQNPKATIGWSSCQEQEYTKSVEACRLGTVIWIGGRR